MGWTIKDILRAPGRVRNTMERIAFGAEPMRDLVKECDEPNSKCPDCEARNRPGCRIRVSK